MYPVVHGPGISIVGLTVRGNFFVYPVRFLIANAASTGYFARGPGPVERTALRAVAERLEPVLLLRRVPVVDDHLHRHPAAPEAGRTLRCISPGIQASMATFPVCR